MEKNAHRDAKASCLQCASDSFSAAAGSSLVWAYRYERAVRLRREEGRLPVRPILRRTLPGAEAGVGR